jgi:hypothetical protein
MQTFYSYFSFIILLQGLFVQSIWLYIGRLSRDRYLKDIMRFRSPSSALARYYGWRVDSFGNALIEGIGLEFVLVGFIAIVAILMTDFATLMQQSLIVLFVAVLTFLSSMQLAWRVRAINTAEEYIVTSVKISDDKIGVARRMVDELYQQGEMGDGRMWFALFRLSQRQDPIGWAIRDVLMDKNREEEERLMREIRRAQAEEAESKKGPGIES